MTDLRIPNLNSVTARLPGDYAMQGSQDLQAPSDAPAGHGGAANGIGGVWRYCYSTREAAEKARKG